jgi:serine/threonine protein kinase
LRAAPTGPGGPTPGTPAYAAPEQMRGSASAKSDVYALGVILEELLLGTPGIAPFVFAPEVPTDVRVLIARLRAQGAPQRPTSAEAVSLLEEALRRRPEAAATRIVLPQQPMLTPATTSKGSGTFWGALLGAAALLGLTASASRGGRRWDSSVGRYRWPDGTFAPR